MEASAIIDKLGNAWQDASAQWKDEYASRFGTAVITELENMLSCIQKSSNQLDEAIDTAITSLRTYMD